MRVIQANFGGTATVETQEAPLNTRVLSMREYKFESSTKEKKEFYASKYKQFRADSVKGKTEARNFHTYLFEHGLDYSCVSLEGVYLPKEDFTAEVTLRTARAIEAITRINTLIATLKEENS